ncbi:MAG: ParA family protein [Pseudomonadales bacterium]|nr:ParA family protein [Pseudomonadales bacterium]
MRRVVFNQKGGVGKSSITVNLAAVAASRGKRTLILDLDPQCNASQYVLADKITPGRESVELNPNIGQFFGQTLSFKLKERPLSDYVHATAFENLSIIPSNAELMEIEQMLESKHKIYKLAGALKQISRQYDEVFIDTAPAFNFFTLSALIAAETCLIPFDCDAFSRRALYTLLENIQETRSDHNDELKVEGIIVNQFQPRASLPQKLVEELRMEGHPVMRTMLSSSVIMRESHERSLPLIHLAPRHKLTEEFGALYDELHS